MDAEKKIVEHRIEPERITELKKSYPVMKLVTFNLDKDDGSVEVWEALFAKPSPLVFRDATNKAQGGDIYSASATLVMNTLVFPAKDVMRKLIEENPSLALTINGELSDLMSSVSEISSKKV
jgi:hypothetical protein